MAFKSYTLKLIDLVTIFKLVTDNFQGFKQQLEAEHEGWIKMSENLLNRHKHLDTHIPQAVSKQH